MVSNLPQLDDYGKCTRCRNLYFGKDYATRAPKANTIIPFTRNVVGSMDYTPVIFSDLKNEHKTTYAHELALSIVFESGWQHFGDAVEQYLKLPDGALTILKRVPTVWDEVKLLEGYPGKHVVLARRKGSSWFIGAINGEGIAKELTLDFSFIKSKANLLIVGDGENDDSFSIQQMEAPLILNLKILPYGGASMILDPIELTAAR